MAKLIVETIFTLNIQGKPATKGIIIEAESIDELKAIFDDMIKKFVEGE